MTHPTSGRFAAAASFLGAIAAAGLAHAQAPAARAPAAATVPPRAPAVAGPAQAPLPNGPAIPGLCVFSKEGVVANSAVGKYVLQRLQQLQSQAQAEVQAESTALQTDAKTLEGQRATLTTEVLQQRALTLQQRDAALQRKAEQRGRELDLTQQNAFGRVMTEATPLLRIVYTSRQCSLLLDANGVMGANAAFDITPDVIRQLDAKITTFPFDRARLEQPAAAGAAAQPARP